MLAVCLWRWYLLLIWSCKSFSWPSLAGAER